MMLKPFFATCLGLGLFLTALTNVGISQEKAKVYLFNNDFPPDLFVNHPQPPVRDTQFWRYLDKAFKNTSLELTENLEEANYRVELHCVGITWCSKLRVDVLSPTRDVLATYKLPGRPLYLGHANTERTANRLAESLDKRINLINEGGVGNYGQARPNIKNY